MSNYRLDGFDAPSSHHNADLLPALSLWVLVVAVLMFASYAMIWSAAQMRYGRDHNQPVTVAVPRHFR